MTAHGRTCQCNPCGGIRFNLSVGRPHVAMAIAIESGVITGQHIELAWLTGLDPLRIAGFGVSLDADETQQVTYAGLNIDDPDHEYRAAMAEVRRLRAGIRELVDSDLLVTTSELHALLDPAVQA